VGYHLPVKPLLFGGLSYRSAASGGTRRKRASPETFREFLDRRPVELLEELEPAEEQVQAILNDLAEVRAAKRRLDESETDGN
jgi:hypothetical protein